MTRDDADLLLYVHHILQAPEALHTFHQRPLTKRQRIGLAPRCSFSAPLLVRGVARALRDFHHLFPDIPIDPTLLELAQDRATLLRRIRDILATYHQMASDAYLAQQGQATEEALNVTRQLQAALPFRANLDPLRRTVALTSPLLYLRGQQVRKERSQRRNQETARAHAQGRKTPRR